MKELSLNILDIAENSLKAGSKLTEIIIEETEDKMLIKIVDNGCGMKKEVVNSVENPFFTTRTTRNVGMGIPLFRLQAEQTGGNLSIFSKHIDDFPENHGTAVEAYFNKKHIDYTPLGDIVSTVLTLIRGHPEVDFLFLHKMEKRTVSLDTRELREVLGDIPLNTIDVIKWIKEYLLEQYSDNNQ